MAQKGDSLYFSGRDKTHSTIEPQISRKTPSNSAANSLSLFPVTLDQKNPHFFFFPAPFQLHLSSLTEKVWNRLKVGLQNKKLLACCQACLEYTYTVGPKRETKGTKIIL